MKKTEWIFLDKNREYKVEYSRDFSVVSKIPDFFGFEKTEEHSEQKNYLKERKPL